MTSSTAGATICMLIGPKRRVAQSVARWRRRHSDHRATQVGADPVLSSKPFCPPPEPGSGSIPGGSSKPGGVCAGRNFRAPLSVFPRRGVDEVGLTLFSPRHVPHRPAAGTRLAPTARAQNYTADARPRLVLLCALQAVTARRLRDVVSDVFDVRQLCLYEAQGMRPAMRVEGSRSPFLGLQPAPCRPA